MFDFKRINLGITLYILILSVLMHMLPNGKGEVGDKIWHLFLYLIQGGDWTVPIIYPLWILCFIQLVFLFKRNDKKIDYFFLIIMNFFFLNILNYLIILAGFLFFYHGKPLWWTEWIQHSQKSAGCFTHHFILSLFQQIHCLFSLKIIWKFRQGIDERYVFKGVLSAAGNFGIFAVMVYT